MKDIEEFLEWNLLKSRLHCYAGTPIFHDGEIWWTAVGKNIKVEINGKSEKFSRPVLILKKLSKDGFIGVPLTSQNKTGTWYVSFSLLDRTVYAALSQIRSFSVSRLYNQMGRINNTELNKIKEALFRLIR